MNKKHGAAGFATFNRDGTKTLLIQAKDKSWSSPHGRPQASETLIETAVRALKEQTGISMHQVLVVPAEAPFQEVNSRQQLAVQYFIVGLKDGDEKKFEDDNKIAGSWFTLDEINNNNFCREIKNERKKIIGDAQLLYQQAFNTDSLVEYVPREVQEPKQKKVKSQSNSDSNLSHALSQLLRHSFVERKLNLDSAAYASIQDVLALPGFSKYSISDLERVVKNNNKQRFAILYNDNDNNNNNNNNNNTPIRIRCNQGHSNGSFPDLLTKITTPLPCCIHGTYENIYDQFIAKEGIKKMLRNEIHCAQGLLGEDKNIISGARVSADTFIYINMDLAMKDGIEFFLSQNGVILTKGQGGILLPKYFAGVQFKNKEREAIGTLKLVRI